MRDSLSGGFDSLEAAGSGKVQKVSRDVEYSRESSTMLTLSHGARDSRRGSKVGLKSEGQRPSCISVASK